MVDKPTPLQAYINRLCEQMYINDDGYIPEVFRGATPAERLAERERPLHERVHELSKGHGDVFAAAVAAALRPSGEAATLSAGLPHAGRAPSPGVGEPTHPRERGSILHKLPIGHLVFTVRQDDEAILAHNSRHQCNVHGYTNMSTQEIVLATEDHEGHPIANGQRRTTLLHEVLHAALEASGLERDCEDEERWINALQGPLLVALQDKRFRELLTDSLRGSVEVTPQRIWASREDLELLAVPREMSRAEGEQYREAQRRVRQMLGLEAVE